METIIREPNPLVCDLCQHGVVIFPCALPPVAIRVELGIAPDLDRPESPRTSSRNNDRGDRYSL